jgi:DNA-binding beta-propeller fold protein YncE
MAKYPWRWIIGVVGLVLVLSASAGWYLSYLHAQQQEAEWRAQLLKSVDSLFISPLDTIVRNSFKETVRFPARCRFVPTGEGQGLAPKSCNFSPDGKLIAVTLLSGKGVDMYTTDSLKLIKKLRPPCPNPKNNWGYPEGEFHAKTGEFWFSRMTTGEFFIWNPKTDQIETHSAKGVWTKVMRFNPSNNLIAFAHWSSRNVTVFDVQTRQLVKDIQVGSTPRGITWLDDTTFVVALFGEGRVKAFHARTGRFIFSPEEVKGDAMRDIRYDPQTGMLYFDDLGIPYVFKYDWKNRKLLGKVRVDYCPNTIGLTPDGKFLFVSCRGPNNPRGYTLPSPRHGINHLIRTADFQIVEKWEGGNQPTGLALSPDGEYLATTDFQYGKLNLFYIKDLSAYELPRAVKQPETSPIDTTHSGGENKE